MKKFKKNDKRDTMIIIAIVIVVGLVVSTNLIKSHANFNTSRSFNIIQGKIPNKNNGDVTLAVKLDGEKYKEVGFPSKEGHKYVETKCNNDAEYSFDKNTWKITVTTNKPTVCTIYFETADNLNLNGSEPVVKEGLVPVIIGNDGVVTKTETNDINWYDYNNSKWANAVILTGIDNYQVGDTIPEEAIESYFVWIPKYRYKLFNTNKDEILPQEIEIQIGDYNTLNSGTECVATNISGDLGTCQNDMWMTHPAFQSIDDSEDNSKIKGIWVGKFITTGEINKLSIKPDEKVITSLTLSSMYNSSYNYRRTNNNNNLDSHMMKNTEYGAILYLMKSYYGIGNNSLVANESHSNNEFIYYFSNGLKNSTTYNVTGIYDMHCSGIAIYLMANLNNNVSSSDLNFSNIKSKYYDKYLGEEILTYKILGDATSEMNIYPNLSSKQPFFLRSLWGEWSVLPYEGYAYHDRAFRIVLSPTN